jgi:hypothetical protein
VKDNMSQQRGLNQKLERAGPDSFGGAKRYGHATIEVPLVPMLLNPFRSQPTAYLKVDGNLWAIVATN